MFDDDDFDDFPADYGEPERVHNLGPCCACGESGPAVRNIVMLSKKSPIPGRGWGCLQCGLPGDGASVVVCDKCLEAKAPYRFACRGYPLEDGRVPIDSLEGTHEHDLSKHPEHNM